MTDYQMVYLLLADGIPRGVVRIAGETGLDEARVRAVVNKLVYTSHVVPSPKTYALTGKAMPAARPRKAKVVEVVAARPAPIDRHPVANVWRAA